MAFNYLETPSYPSFPELKALISSKFNVLDAYIDERGIPNFIISPEITKENFKKASKEFMKLNLMPFLRKEENRYVIKILLKPFERKGKSNLLNLILLNATLGTIFLAGYYSFINTPILKEILMKGENAFFQAALFTISLFAIIGLHESGHILACKIHGLAFSLPYFIPGPPPFGTFGAIVSTAGCFSAWVLIQGRVAFALAREERFWRPLAYVHPRYATPSHALIFSSILSAIIIVLIPSFPV